MLPLLGIEKKEENWFIPSLKNCAHEQKKAPNESTKCAINRKSLSTSQNERFLEKCNFIGPKSYFHSNKYLKKNNKKKTVSCSRSKTFLRYWPPSKSSNGFEKHVNERILFPLKRKSVATGCNKGFVKNKFLRDGKTTSIRRVI